MYDKISVEIKCETLQVCAARCIMVIRFDKKAKHKVQVLFSLIPSCDGWPHLLTAT